MNLKQFANKLGIEAVYRRDGEWGYRFKADKYETVFTGFSSELHAYEGWLKDKGLSVGFIYELEILLAAEELEK